MHQKVFRVMALLVALSMMVSPLSAFPVAVAAGPASSEVSTHTLTEGLPEGRTPPSYLEEVPDEVKEFFGEGLSADEFVKLTGYVPAALESLVSDQKVMMVIELQQEPLAVVYAQNKKAGVAMKAATMTDYIGTLEKAQSKVEASLGTMNVNVVSHYTTVFNGFLASVPLNSLKQVVGLPEVKAVYRAPEHVPALATSVDMIGATDVWEDYGYDGEGIVIAVIDTGIDYTHATFGGIGTPEAYAYNNPNIIEMRTFPTEKVIDGYDLAGTKYNASCSAANEAAGICSTIPTPDLDPLDEGGHGTHVASIAAGIGTTKVGPGVAPKAKLIALKVFGASGSTNLTMNALDLATYSYIFYGEPHVINMSLGSNFGADSIADPSVRATENAVAAGIFVAASAGNALNTAYITGSPGTSTSAISVASVDNTEEALPYFTVSPDNTKIGYSAATGAPTPPTSGSLPMARTGTTTSVDDGCDPISLNLTGKAVLIRRGTCSFYIKSKNAQTAGAAAVVIYNNTTGRQNITVAPTAPSDPPITIPVVAISASEGALIDSRLQAGAVTMTWTPNIGSFPSATAGFISSFSSRGPRSYDSAIKPEITAPGGSIFAAARGSGDSGVSMSGTSMAAPHIAGVAALVLQANPDWTPEFVKASMMNTAGTITDSFSVVPRSGAGLVNAYRAVDASVLAIGDEGLTSLSFGVPTGSTNTVTAVKHVTLYNTGAQSQVYDVAWSFQTGSRTAGVSLAVSPARVTVAAGSTADVTVTLTADLTLIPVNVSATLSTLEEYFGFVTFSPYVPVNYYIYLPLIAKGGPGTLLAREAGSTVAESIKVPFYLQPRPHAALQVTGNTDIYVPDGEVTLDLTHTGPVASSLWVFPALVVENTPEKGNPGDIRMFGMDYGGYDPTYGHLAAVGINTWAPSTVPQPSIAEFDLYVDYNEDGVDDYVFFNWNYGAATGSTNTNTWVVVRVNLATGALSLGTPYTIYTDYNSGFQEWYPQFSQLGISTSDTTLNYELIGLDLDDSVDYTTPGSFDFAKSPFEWTLDTRFPGPADRTAELTVWIYSMTGLQYSKAKGIMLVDYKGDIRNGKQVTFIPVAYNPVQPLTILHTNDFHGNLEPAGSNPGAARAAQKIVDVRTAVGAENVLLFDAGDIMQGSLLSNLQKGLPTFDYYRTIGYNAATFGNHEFDWGQEVLGERILQAEGAATADETPMAMIVANITKKDGTGACTWEPFNASVAPYEVFTAGTAAGQVKVGVIGVGSIETPYITIAEATEGLCFRDPFEAISRYYTELDAVSDVIVVLSHNGWTDGGYGYGFTVYGDQTLAKKLNDAGKPVNLIIGGHSHTDISAAVVVGNTTVVQAHYAGRKVGRANLTYNHLTGAVGITWTKIVVGTSDAQYPPIKALVDGYVNDPTYQALINQPVGYAQVDLLRDYNGDNMMGSFVDDAIYGALNNDTDATNDVDMFFNNAGGIRVDWCDKEDPLNPGTYIWTSTAADCQKEGVWSHDPMLLTYGHMFQILPFGNATAVGTMTGAQIYDLLQQSATLFKGAIQPSGLRYKFYRYSDSQPGPQPYAWGAYDIEVWDQTAGEWAELDMDRTYKVGTNEFLAPAGQDGYTPFKYMKDITYWGDMLDSVNAWVSANYTSANPYKGPDGDGTLDGRITRNGDGDDVYEAGEVVPLTILHHNDSHGRLLPTSSAPGYTNLVTVINQERLHNPDRTLLLTSGDNIQGDSMMYYFKSAGLGYAADGTALADDLKINPLIKAFNAVGYDAMVVGNHEYNFGKDVFGTLAQAAFPMLQANVTDDGAYGLAAVPVQPYVEKTLGPEEIKVAILGIGNHRVPSYELPSNIPGLTFSNPIAAGQDYAPGLQADNDVVIALTHIGFTTDPASVEVDSNVDTYFAAQVAGVDAVIGGHSHTRPETGFGPYKFLPTFIPGQDNVPVLVSQAYRYNTNLGQVVLGLLPDGAGGYKVVSRAGRYIPITTSTAEDAATKTLIQPYKDLIDAYNNTVIGSTITPIDALDAYKQETNGANLQADASVWKLEHEGIEVDIHLSGAMTNSKIAAAATPSTPVTLKVSDMFSAMPYENSLVVIEMTGEQIKAVLERSYRNYYYYKYVPGYGGYSYYTTCFLVTDHGNEITYNDEYPTLPNGNNVVSLKIGDETVDLTDTTTKYRVSTVNYLAAGACNMSDGGVTLWPLTQIVADTQYYVRDAVIEYVQQIVGPINPVIEGRLKFE